MSEALLPRGRRTLLLPALFTFAGVALLVALGIWQLERKMWKERLISAISTQMSRPPQVLPASSSWAQLTQAEAEFRRVRFSAALGREQAYVYAPSAGARRGELGPGYFVFARARLADGMQVVINRGFVPEGRQQKAQASATHVSESIEIVGALRWPESSRFFSPADDPASNLWFRRDHVAIAAAKGWGSVGPFYVELQSPTPPGGLPLAGPVSITLKNNHMAYAVTWFGLAAGLLAVFLFFALERRRN